MKVLLEFDLPEEIREYNSAMNGSKYKYVLFGLNEWLKTQINFPKEDMPKERIKSYELTRSKLLELIIEYGIGADTVDPGFKETP